MVAAAVPKRQQQAAKQTAAATAAPCLQVSSTCLKLAACCGISASSSDMVKAQWCGVLLRHAVAGDMRLAWGHIDESNLVQCVLGAHRWGRHQLCICADALTGCLCDGCVLLMSGRDDVADTNFLEWLRDTVYEAVKIAERHESLKLRIREARANIEHRYQLASLQVCVKQMAGLRGPAVERPQSVAFGLCMRGWWFECLTGTVLAAWEGRAVC